jgi:hypothetical protein
VSLPEGMSPCPSTPEKPSSPWASCSGFAEAPASPPLGVGPCLDVPGKEPSSPGAFCGYATPAPDAGGGSPVLSLPSGAPPCPSTPEKPSSPWASCDSTVAVQDGSAGAVGTPP